MQVMTFMWNIGNALDLTQGAVEGACEDVCPCGSNGVWCTDIISTTSYTCTCLATKALSLTARLALLTTCRRRRRRAVSSWCHSTLNFVAALPDCHAVTAARYARTTHATIAIRTKAEPTVVAFVSPHDAALLPPPTMVFSWNARLDTRVRRTIPTNANCMLLTDGDDGCVGVCALSSVVRRVSSGTGSGRVPLGHD